MGTILPQEPHDLDTIPAGMSFIRGFRYALRGLSRSPGLTAALLATIAVGTGTHAALTGFVNGLLTRSVAIPEGRDVVVVEAADEAALKRTSAFAAIGTFRETREAVSIDGHAASMTAVTASPGFWDVVRVPPALGQMSGVVISDRVWRDVFHGTSDVPGQTIAVSGRALRIGGVAPDWFEGVYLGRPVDVWITAPADPAAAGSASALARIATGWTFEDVRRNLSGQPVIRYT